MEMDDGNQSYILVVSIFVQIKNTSRISNIFCLRWKLTTYIIISKA